MLLSNPRFATTFPPIEEESDKYEGILLLEESKTRGTVIRGAPGSGKTALDAMIVYGDLLRGKPALVIDAKGPLKRQVVRLILRNPEARRKALLSRLRLWPVGHPKHTYTLPWLHPPGPHDRRAARFLDVVMKLLPSLEDAPIMGRPSLYAIGEPVLMILSALGFQLPQSIDFLYDVGTENGFWKNRLYEAERLVPQAVRMLRKTYLQWPEQVRKERRYAFESHVYPYILSDTLRALVGSNKVLDLQAMEDAGITLLVDTSGIEETVVRDQFTIHLFLYFLDYIRRRGVGDVKPWALMLEEAAVLMRTAALIPEIQSLANEFRNNRLQTTISFQSLDQISEDLVNLLYSFGNHWIGKTSSREESDLEADFLLQYQPHLMKFEGYASYGRGGMQTGHNNPIFYTVDEQKRLLSERLSSQQGRQFAVRRYLDESTVDQQLHWVHTTLDLPDTRMVSEQELQEAEEENLETYGQDIPSILREVDRRIPNLTIVRKKPEKREDRRQVVPKQLL